MYVCTYVFIYIYICICIYIYIYTSKAGLLRAEDGLIPKDPLCRSVQGEVLKCVLPVWRQGDFKKFPEGMGQSVMKVWVHTLDGPRDIPPRPTPRAAAAAAETATTRREPAPLVPAAAAAAPDSEASSPGGRAAASEESADRAAQAIVGTLVDMGFAREQVERGLRELGHTGGDAAARRGNLDIGSLIMWMVSNPEPAGGGEPAAAAATLMADYTILYNTLLYYTLLYCTILYYTILYYNHIFISIILIIKRIVIIIIIITIIIIMIIMMIIMMMRPRAA